MYFSDICIENTRIHNHYTMLFNNIHKKCNRTNLGVYSTRNKVIRIWNTIPLELKQSFSVNIFKNRLNSFYYQNNFCILQFNEY